RFLYFFFFFFQAEDGIRDLTVTGVQTCALPISGRINRTAGDVGVRRSVNAAIVSDEQNAGRPGNERERVLVDVHHLGTAAVAARSEERRVGKECRSWGARAQEKKKHTVNGRANG